MCLVQCASQVMSDVKKGKADAVLCRGRAGIAPFRKIQRFTSIGRYRVEALGVQIRRGGGVEGRIGMLERPNGQEPCRKRELHRNREASCGTMIIRSPANGESRFGGEDWRERELSFSRT